MCVVLQPVANCIGGKRNHKNGEWYNWWGIVTFWLCTEYTVIILDKGYKNVHVWRQVYTCTLYFLS